jgi:hypothetical protein
MCPGGLQDLLLWLAFVKNAFGAGRAHVGCGGWLRVVVVGGIGLMLAALMALCECAARGMSAADLTIDEVCCRSETRCWCGPGYKQPDLGCVFCELNSSVAVVVGCVYTWALECR